MLAHLILLLGIHLLAHRTVCMLSRTGYIILHVPAPRYIYLADMSGCKVHPACGMRGAYELSDMAITIHSSVSLITCPSTNKRASLPLVVATCGGLATLCGGFNVGAGIRMTAEPFPYAASSGTS
ncbi:hypothetical protein F4861DRAFT_388091 [Xylaria intraflava]|nr:hypothetical protein F4861DRAFT_388091 [Xylaria intraflava]